MGVCMSIKNEESLWNFDNVKGLNTLSEPKTQKKKKANPFDVKEHKKAMEKPLDSSENQATSISQKLSPSLDKKQPPVAKNVVLPQKEHKTKSVVDKEYNEEIQGRVDINKLLKKQNKQESVKEEDSVVKPVNKDKESSSNQRLAQAPAEINNDSSLKASQDVKNALSKIKQNRKDQPVFDVVAYNQQHSKPSLSLVSKQMGQFSLSVQKSVPDILKGTGWDKATTEQKNMAKKISSIICIFLVAGIVGFGLARLSVSQPQPQSNSKPVVLKQRDTDIKKEVSPVKESLNKEKQDVK